MKLQKILVFTSLCSLSAANAAELNRPNVILINADDMGKGMLSINGQKHIKTPNIDKIFSSGVHFSNAYGGHLSAPARAMLLTGYSDCREGRYSVAKGGQLLFADTIEIAQVERELDDQRIKLPEGDHYLAQIFKQAGYTTGQIGKLGYSFSSTRSEMIDQGWDHYYGYLDHVRCHGFYPPYLFEDGEIVFIEGNTHADCAKTERAKIGSSSLDMSGKSRYSQDLFNVKIKDFLQTNCDRPFFLYHPTQLPHGPLSIPYIHEQVVDMDELSAVEKEYATMMLLLDEAVGMILNEVERLGIEERTIIIFTSDNGHELYTQTSSNPTSKSRNITTGEKVDNYTVKYRSEICGDVFDGNMGMAGLKRSNLEGGSCVPLAYYIPSAGEARLVDDIVAGYDMIATLAEMLEVPINKDKDARSYYSLLTNANSHLPSDKVVVIDSFEGPMIVRNDGWKVRYSPVPQAFELYNIKRDKQEREELSQQHPSILQELVNELKSIIEKTDCRSEAELSIFTGHY